ncbi:hypothetical protein DLJ54_10155 [Corynebacterium heidelbergense]|uniref:Uncharacterized protein n=1 Tax=Corynebacterium heidelbergense TaxID=2055947 RepID=A0A364V395_9CORY|nr:hypothetical protein DLJ54_10155 [Corynebacterium heidelbergense]
MEGVVLGTAEDEVELFAWFWVSSESLEPRALTANTIPPTTTSAAIAARIHLRGDFRFAAGWAPPCGCALPCGCPPSGAWGL